MSRDCTKCISKHSGKTLECDYNEVKKFIEIINSIHNTQYELVNCPDEDNKNIYTVDLEFVDRSSNKKLYLEIKEVKIGFSENKNIDIAKENGQGQIACCIEKAIDALSDEKKCILKDYAFKIPKEQLGSKDYASFIDRIHKFLNKNITSENIKEKKFNFIRKYQNKEIKVEVEIFEKSDELNNITKENIFAYDAKGQSIYEVMKMITDNNTLIEKIDKNFSKTQEIENKFPQDGGKRILLNILRLPIGMEAFYNVAFIEGYGSILVDNLMKKSNEYKEKYPSIDESYFAYYMDEFFTIQEGGTIDNSGSILICLPILEGLIKYDAMLY